MLALSIAAGHTVHSLALVAPAPGVEVRLLHRTQAPSERAAAAYLPRAHGIQAVALALLVNVPAAHGSTSSAGAPTACGSGGVKYPGPAPAVSAKLQYDPAEMCWTELSCRTADGALRCVVSPRPSLVGTRVVQVSAT